MQAAVLLNEGDAVDADDLAAGADFAELLEAENLDQSLGEAGGDVGCITRDQIAEAGDVEFVQVAAGLSADNPVDISPLFDQLGNEFAWVVLEFRTFDALSPADVEGVTTAIDNASSGSMNQPPCVKSDRKLIPFFDSAYQGFASGDIIKDIEPVRYFASKGFSMFVAQSYAKNMGLYGHRVGCLHIVTPDKETASKCMSQMKIIVRGNYSSPPLYGSRIAEKILNSIKKEREEVVSFFKSKL